MKTNWFVIAAALLGGYLVMYALSSKKAPFAWMAANPYIALAIGACLVIGLLQYWLARRAGAGR